MVTGLQQGLGCGLGGCVCAWEGVAQGAALQLGQAPGRCALVIEACGSMCAQDLSNSSARNLQPLHAAP